MDYTGERYVPYLDDPQTSLEHWHRYLYASEFIAGKRVLDIACGEGYGAYLLSRRADSVLGIDVDPQTIAHAASRYVSANLKFATGSATNIPLEGGHLFDVIVSFETVEHLSEDDQRSFLREVRRLLKPGGLFIVSTPNKLNYSDIPDFRNQYHLKELYRNEFVELVGRHFPYVTLFGQRVYPVSYIWPTDGERHILVEHGLDWTERGYRPSEAPKDVLYFLVMASDAPIEKKYASILVDLSDGMFRRHPGQELDQVRSELAAKEGILRVREAEIEALMSRKAEEPVSMIGEEIVSWQLGVLVDSLHRLSALASGFEKSATWRLARLLQRIRRSFKHDPVHEIHDICKMVLKQVEARTVRELEAVPRWAAALASRVGELSSSKTVRLARSLIYAASLIRLKIPGTGALEGMMAAVPIITGAAEVIARLGVGTERLGTRISSSAGAETGGRYEVLYRDMLEQTKKLGTAASFVHLRENEPVQSTVRLIAFYLPQFHPIPENDANWERGFTEWTNVTRAVPQFLGHEQPHLPIDVGFYDLRVPSTLQRQAELARNYGIYGFCFHHYWFGGKRLLRTPVDLLLEHPEIDIHFCLNWANENWTRTWDGLDQDVLVEQKYSPEDDLAFIEDAARYFRDPRYIRVGERPLLIVYRPMLLPNPARTAQVWRDYCRKAGVGDPYLVLTHAFDFTDPRMIGFDAALEYAPNNFPLDDASSTVTLLNRDFQGRLLSYDSAVELGRTFRAEGYVKFRGVCPRWDNEPRCPGRGTILVGSTPRKYQAWLEYACTFTEQHLPPDVRFVFINAWNEWGEGAHLEPDRKYGYAYLQATYDVLKASEEVEKASRPRLRTQSPIAVICHLYYQDLWEEISAYLRNIGERFDLYVTIPREVECGSAAVLAVKRDFPNAIIFRFANRGRDVLPFLRVLEKIRSCGYECVLKVHSKKSPHRSEGDLLRIRMLEALVGSREGVGRIIEVFRKDVKAGVVAPREFVVPIREHWGSNRERVYSLARRMGVDDLEVKEFVAGAMFWFRPSALEPLAELLLGEEDFPEEGGQLDGELHHAVERLTLVAAEIAGYRVIRV